MLMIRQYKIRFPPSEWLFKLELQWPHLSLGFKCWIFSHYFLISFAYIEIRVNWFACFYFKFWSLLHARSVLRSCAYVFQLACGQKVSWITMEHGKLFVEQRNVKWYVAVEKKKLYRFFLQKIFFCSLGPKQSLNMCINLGWMLLILNLYKLWTKVVSSVANCFVASDYII